MFTARLPKFIINVKNCLFVDKLINYVVKQKILLLNLQQNLSFLVLPTIVYTMQPCAVTAIKMLKFL